MEKRKLVGNSLSMLINRLVQSISTFILSAAIARTLGAEALGQYLLAFSYYFIFVSIISQGLKTLYTRELSRHPEKISTFLISGTVLQFLLSFLGYAALVVLVFVLPYSADTSIICYIMGLAIFPFALSNITEAIFQAQERMHLIAVSTVPVYIGRLLFMIVGMSQGYGIAALAGIFVISEFLILLIEWFLIVWKTKIQWVIDRSFIWNTLLTARTFFAIEGIAVVNSRIQILILSLLGSEQLVGIYGGIAQLLQPFSIVANSVVLAIFPSISKAIALGKDKQKQITENVIEMLLCISLPFLVGLYLIGGDLLNFVYGDSSFGDATVALRISALILISSPFNRALSYLLVANSMEKTNLIEVLVTTTIGGISGVFLVSNFGLIGASCMDITMSASASIQYIFTTYRRLFSLRLSNIFKRPLLMSLYMAFVLLGLQKTSFNFLSILVIGTALYCLCAAMMMSSKLRIHQSLLSRWIK